jgi:hypothetical protein
MLSGPISGFEDGKDGMTRSKAAEFVFPYRGAVDRDEVQTAGLPRPLDPERLLAGGNCRFLQTGRNRIGVLTCPSGEGETIELVIKEFRVRGARLLRCLAAPSPAKRAWRGALWLRECGLGTPAPVAYMEDRRGPLLKSCYYITRYAGDCREIREMLDSPGLENPRRLLRDLAGFAAGCHRRGILHRDLSDGNVMVKEEPGGYSFSLVDTNRIRKKRRIGVFRGVRNIIRLGIPSSLRTDFLGFYLGKERTPPFLRMWYAWNKGVYTRRIIWKKKLRLRRIAEAMRIQ